jgi:DNA-binding GntR family transcriptional regulator
VKTPLKRPVALAPPPPSRRSATSLSSDQIYERILAAITEHRLPPGMQLVEDRLARIFDVSRTKIREATGRLVHDRIAINIPNRGAFIASPTADEAREVFAARRLIEPELMRLAVRNATARQITSLRAHVRKETAARNSSKPHAIITLSGEFHLLVAEIAGNGFLLRTLRELESLTSLIIRLYDTAGGPNCPYDDHAGLVDAIEARNAERAAALMLHHLEHIESSLDLSPPTDSDFQLEDAFI